MCPNCVAVDQGRIVDWLLELDAASNNGVANIRELIERIPLGTSGNRKVVILDEVHMLSTGAANALLKSLEEPPAHVVFILATTDPQKVLPTIRSRTQHFEFHLLPADELADHVRHVIKDAELGLGEDAVDHVVRQGGGSGPRHAVGPRPGVGHGRRGRAGPAGRGDPRGARGRTTPAPRSSPWPTPPTPAATPGPSARCSSARSATRSSP